MCNREAFPKIHILNKDSKISLNRKEVQWQGKECSRLLPKTHKKVCLLSMMCPHKTQITKNHGYKMRSALCFCLALWLKHLREQFKSRIYFILWFQKFQSKGRRYPQRPAPGNLLPLDSPHILKWPQPSKTAPQTGKQTFRTWAWTIHVKSTKNSDSGVKGQV